MSYQTGTASGYIDFLTKLDAFLTTTGHCWGLAYSGTGNGTLTGYIGTAGSVVETVTATATSSTSFTVVGSVSGSLGTATVGTLYSGSKCAFTINAGGTAFVAGDAFTFNTSPKWTRQRLAGVSEVAKYTASMTGYSVLIDGSSTTGVTGVTMPAWVQIENEYATTVKSFSVGCTTAATGPATFSLQHSDDGATWTTHASYSGVGGWAANELRTYVQTSPPAKKYWRVYITASSGASLTLNEVRFYGDEAASWPVDSRIEFCWIAPGVDGAKTIPVSGYTYTSAGSDTWNLVFTAFRYWTVTDQSVKSITPAGTPVALPLSKATFAYWFVAHGGRVIVMARISGVYMFAYAGFGLPYELPGDHSFPMMVGACSSTESTRYDSTSGSFRNPCDPGQTTLNAMAPDGTWKGYGNRYTGTGDGSAAGSGQSLGVTWPYAEDTAGNIGVNGIRDNNDGTKPTLPIVLTHYSPKHTWGEFDGVYWTTGYATTSETLLTDGAIKLIVWQNCARTSANHYCAIALD